MVESDIPQCLSLTTDRFLYTPDQLASVGRLWSKLIVERTGVPPTIITNAKSPSEVLWFGATAFVSDERADRYHRLASPRIGLQMAEELNAGGRPFLSRAEVAQANASAGVNLVGCHHGYELRYDEIVERLRATTYEMARKYLTAWNLRSYTNEIFSPNAERDGKQMGEALGFRVLAYTAAQLQAAGIPADKAPWVWLATRQDAVAKPAGLPLAMLFLSFSVPRFGFTVLEQEALELALDGLTDESIARTTGASLSTIKKRFRAIYEKVQDETFEDGGLGLSRLNDGARGVETRRRLLNYLRDHREELRPYSPIAEKRPDDARAHVGPVPT